MENLTYSYDFTESKDELQMKAAARIKAAQVVWVQSKVLQAAPKQLSHSSAGTAALS